VTGDAEEIKAALRRAYDTRAAERDMRDLPEFRAPIRREFARLLAASGGGRLLDLGAGAGQEAAWFADAGVDVIALDLSPENVVRCRARGVDAVVGDFYDLGFPDASFDGVWAMSSLLHVPDVHLPEVLAEVERVLRPHGLFQVGLWGGPGTEGPWEGDDHDPPRFYSLRTDDRARELFTARFVEIAFSTTVPEHARPGVHYQVLLLRRA
jgi:SAM-dependent methyltransferase